MHDKISCSFLFLLLNVLASPLSLLGQTPNEKEPLTIQINRMDVVYEDEEWSGIVIHQRVDENDECPTVAIPQTVVDDNDQELNLPKLLQPTEDEGVESENDILYASFDSEVIHYPKLDISKIDTTIRLVSARHTFSFPTPETARTTSRFGPRRRRFHYGIDLAMPTGEPIYASFDGTVRISKYNSSYGNLVVIRHDNGMETYYAHLSRRHVSPGQEVKAGEVIGLCGNTGRSYGSHLHFEIRYLGNAINPEHIIDCATHQLKSETYHITPSSFRKVSSGGSQSSGVSTTASGAQYYKVRSGDTLGKIAKRNGTTIKRLCQLNGIKETTILQIGKRLRIR